MSANMYFTKENLDICLRALAKEFRKRNGKTMPAEIILIGGASILVNYGFRDMTNDIDALIQASSAMKEAINYVGDELGLPYGWINSDFIKTGSYTPKLVNYARYYKTFSNILTVRSISGEYLVAMKLKSMRQYKNDISDIVGIFREQQEVGDPLSFEKVETAVMNLYGSWDSIPDEAQRLIKRIQDSEDLDSLYQECREEEKINKEVLTAFDKDYPGVLKEGNLKNIMESLNTKKDPQRKGQSYKKEKSKHLVPDSGTKGDSFEKIVYKQD